MKANWVRLSTAAGSNRLLDFGSETQHPPRCVPRTLGHLIYARLLQVLDFHSCPQAGLSLHQWFCSCFNRSHLPLSACEEFVRDQEGHFIYASLEVVNFHSCPQAGPSLHWWYAPVSTVATCHCQHATCEESRT